MKRTSSPFPSCSTQRSTPFALTVGTCASLERRPPIGPGTESLERRADPQRLVVLIAAGDDLKADRQPILAPTGGDAERGALADEIELAGHVETVVEAVTAVPIPDEVVLVDRTSGLGHRRAEQRVEALE